MLKLSLLVGIIFQLFGTTVSVIAVKNFNSKKEKKQFNKSIFKQRMDKLIEIESGGFQGAISKRKGKSKAYTKYQINGYGLEYFNHFNRLRVIIKNGVTNKYPIHFTMSQIRRSVKKSKIVSEWIVKKAITHYKRITSKHHLVLAYNSYNMGYGNTSKGRFHPAYVKAILPYEWERFTHYYEPYKKKGLSVWYRRRRPARSRSTLKRVRMKP